MSKWIAVAASIAGAALASGAITVGCANNGETGFGDGGAASAVNGAACPECVSDSDCAAGSACAQFGSDIFCAPTCPKGNECSSDRACSVETSAAGEQVSVCTPNDNACGGRSAPASNGGNTSTCTPTTSDDAGSSDPNRCGSLVGPAETATCTACSASSSSCQANGCYGGWWCDTSSNSCHATPTNCPTSASDAGSSTGGSVNCTFDAGSTPITGTVGGSGGSASRLFFGVVGDTRPPNPDETSSYPTAIITKIYSDIAALSPQPLFVVGTGDYMFTTPGKGTAAPQLSLYMGARKQFSGPLYPAMGNHECTGATASNCATSATENLNAFLSTMLAPIAQTKPYYSLNVNATDNSWTAKFVFIAANAWDSTQASWLTTTLSTTTTYTFVIRHEATEANTAPGVTPSDTIVAAHPYTLMINGHTHTYAHYSDAPKVIIVGNGGAPITGSADYGFGLVLQRADGTLQIDMIDYMSNLFDPSFRFAIHPDGSSAPL
jgi:hypothetical protein